MSLLKLSLYTFPGITWKSVNTFLWNSYQVCSRTWKRVFFKALQMIPCAARILVPTRRWFSNFRWNKEHLWHVPGMQRAGSWGTAPSPERISSWSQGSPGICLCDRALVNLQQPSGGWTVSEAAIWRCPDPSIGELPSPGHCPKNQKHWEGVFG